MPPSETCESLENKGVAVLSNNLLERTGPKSYSSVVQKEKLKPGDKNNMLTRKISISLSVILHYLQQIFKALLCIVKCISICFKHFVKIRATILHPLLIVLAFIRADRFINSNKQ